MWRVYYDDSSYSTDELTQPFRVIAIVQPRYKTGREVLRGHPYYILHNDTWRPAEDIASLVQQLAYNISDISLFGMGIWTDEDNYNAIIHAAIHDEGLPRRSAKDPDRRR